MQVICLLPVVAILEFTFAFSEKHDQRHDVNVATNQFLLFKVKKLKIDSTKQYRKKSEQLTNQFQFK